MTLADKLRAMTDEELAKWFCKNFFPEAEDCIKCPATSMCTLNSNGMVKLLKKEVANVEASKSKQGEKEAGNQSNS